MIYKFVPKFSGYLVGDDGTVWSSKAAGGSLVFDGVKYKQLRGAVRPDGYVCVGLAYGGRSYSQLIHRVVLAAFVGPCPQGMQGCHIDGNKLNNSRANLRYDTPAGNHRDKLIHGTTLRGEQIKQAKLTGADVPRIRFLADYGVPQSVLADVWHISRAQVCRIIGKQRWVF